MTPPRLDLRLARAPRGLARPLPLTALLLALALATAATPATASAGDDRWLTSVDAARAAAQKGDKLIFVDLYAEWCGWCKKLEREVFAAPEFERLTRDWVLLRVDVDDRGEGSELQARFRAFTLPTALILDANLGAAGQVNGYAPTAQYLEKVRREVDNYERLVASFERAMEAPLEEDYGRRLVSQVAVNLHARNQEHRAARLYERLLPTLEGVERSGIEARLADARLVAGDLEGAGRALATARRRLATGATDETSASLREQIDLLDARLAQQLGDCPRAVASLERFLAEHPASPMVPQARRALSELTSQCA